MKVVWLTEKCQRRNLGLMRKEWTWCGTFVVKMIRKREEFRLVKYSLYESYKLIT